METNAEIYCILSRRYRDGDTKKELQQSCGYLDSQVTRRTVERLLPVDERQDDRFT